MFCTCNLCSRCWHPVTVGGSMRRVDRSRGCRENDGRKFFQSQNGEGGGPSAAHPEGAHGRLRSLPGYLAHLTVGLSERSCFARRKTLVVIMAGGQRPAGGIFRIVPKLHRHRPWVRGPGVKDSSASQPGRYVSFCERRSRGEGG